MLLGERKKGNNDVDVALGGERIHPFTFRKNAISSDTSDEYIEATINFSDAELDASSQRTLSVNFLRTITLLKAAFVIDQAITNQISCAKWLAVGNTLFVAFPSVNYLTVSLYLLVIIRNDKLSAFDVYFAKEAPSSYGAKTEAQQDDSRNPRRAEEGTRALIEMSAAQRQSGSDLRNEFPVLCQDTKNMKASNAGLVSKCSNIAAEIPFHQILQTASTISSPDKLKRLHRENAALRRHLIEANSYADTVEIENEQNFTTMSNKIDDLYDTLDEKNRLLNIANLRLKEKEQEISKLQERISALEKNNQRQQQVIEVTREEANREKEKFREAAKERAELLLRNASLFHQKREWSIERERLSMELNDVTRELDLQKMLLNGESISEIVQRWESKVFDLEDMVADRDAAIRAQQQRIGELKQMGVRGSGEMSSSESLSSQKAVLRADSAALAHLKRILLQYLANPTEEQYAQLLQSISSVLHLSSEDNFALVEHMKRYTSMLRHPNAQTLR
ncbi:unnamed protein product [Toxocara canis]|uniref:GRIP domain-containing protein n=1 Tax=Toxocara canis TaxID=6265 RepID=A0A183TXQ4_TOXCA|nr:unnamed protein product [Toxocara canis]